MQTSTFYSKVSFSISKQLEPDKQKYLAEIYTKFLTWKFNTSQHSGKLQTQREGPLSPAVKFHTRKELTPFLNGNKPGRWEIYL